MYSNQFGQSVVKGLVDLRFNSNTVSCRVEASESTALVAGQLVKMVDSAGGTPEVTAATVNTDAIFGVVNFNLKQSSFEAGDSVEISLFCNVVYMEASAAIARGADVMPVITGQKVATATAGKSVIGIALDKAAADGDLIRVLIEPLKVSGEGEIYTEQSAIADLDQDISATYVEAEVQAISDKVDEILAALRGFAVIATS